MIYRSMPYGDFTEETWTLETGYEVKLVTWHGHRVTLNVTDDTGYLFFQRDYGYWQRSQAQQHAEALARMGLASVAVAA